MKLYWIRVRMLLSWAWVLISGIMMVACPFISVGYFVYGHPLEGGAALFGAIVGLLGLPAACACSDMLETMEKDLTGKKGWKIDG